MSASRALHWLPAFSGMTCLGFGAGLIGIYGFFVEPLSREFGVGVATINIGPVAFLLVPGIVAPMVGRLVDRVAIRRLILFGISVAMLSLCAVSRAPSLMLAALAFLAFALGLTMYGPVVINGLMVKLYPGKEARALAISAMGISVATATLPPIVGLLLANMDWRSTLLTLAVGLFLILWLVVLSGIPAGAGGVANTAGKRGGEGLYRQAAFWLIGLCVALGFNVAIILAICYPPLFLSQGYSVAEAGWFVSTAGIAGLTGKTGGCRPRLCPVGGCGIAAITDCRHEPVVQCGECCRGDSGSLPVGVWRGCFHSSPPLPEQPLFRCLDHRPGQRGANAAVPALRSGGRAPGRLCL